MQPERAIAIASEINPAEELEHVPMLRNVNRKRPT